MTLCQFPQGGDCLIYSCCVIDPFTGRQGKEGLCWNPKISQGSEPSCHYLKSEVISIFQECTRHSKIGVIKPTFIFIWLPTACPLQTSISTEWPAGSEHYNLWLYDKQAFPFNFSTVQLYRSVFGHVPPSVSVSVLETKRHIMRKQQAISPPPDGLLYQ